jgi:predicted amidohydrolase
MTDLVLAAVQMDVELGDPRANLAAIEGFLSEAREKGADLVVFPECALTGYILDTRDDTLAAGLAIDGPEVARFTQSWACLRGTATRCTTPR